jgi:hypothetical protein
VFTFAVKELYMKITADEDTNLKLLIESLKELGWVVRREKLTRGPSYKVKSGSCKLFGDKVVFIDRQLPVPQQHAFLEEFLAELKPAIGIASGLSSVIPMPGDAVLQMA